MGTKTRIACHSNLGRLQCPRAHTMEGGAMSERLSAWMDGELESGQARRLLTQLRRDDPGRSDWASYHLIGDSLRGVHGPDLSRRILDRLDAEPTLLAPQPHSRPKALWRFALPQMARAAAVAFVAIVAWKFLPPPQQSSPEIAAIPAAEVKQAVVRASQGTRDYLLAHQQYSPGNSMQGLGGYVRVMSQEFLPARQQVR